MEKEEILAKSRIEQQGKNERELYILRNASNIAVYTGFVACFIISILELLFMGSLSFSNWAVYCAMMAGLFYVKYAALHLCHEGIVFFVYSVLTLLFTAIYVYRIIL